MAHDDIERSNYDAQPVVLYSFAIGPNEWHYINGEKTEVIGGVPYLPLAITDNGEAMSGEVTADDFVITMDGSADFVTLFRGTPPSAEITVLKRHWNAGETEAPVVGTYLVRSGRRSDAAGWEITCRALTASLNRNGLRLGWGRGCPHALYDQNCAVNPNNYRVATTVASLTGTSFTAPGLTGFPANYFAGGYFEWEWLPGVLEKRAIESSQGASIGVLGTTDGMQLNGPIALYPGCNRTTAMCNSRFGNILNYGGYPLMPGESPFDGKPVF